MENTMKQAPRKFPAGSRSMASAFLLGFLSIFEVAFDILSLLASLLGGVVLDAHSTSSAPTSTSSIDTTSGIATEESKQIATQLALSKTSQLRPVGVTIIAVLLGILGIFEAGFGGLALVTSLLGSFIFPMRSPAVGAGMGVFYLLVGLVKLFFAWELWRLQRWAFWATIFIVTLSLLSSVLALTQPAPTALALLSEILIPTVILIYFVLDSNVRAAFNI
jgi:hypothetical protein